MWGTQLTFPWVLPPSHLPDLPPPPPTRRVRAWPQSDLFWERWLPVSEGSSLPRRGVEQGRESSQFLLEVSSGYTPAGGWTENPPSQFGGCCLLHCPAPLTAPPEFRVGVLVTANVCVGLAGRWVFLPLSRVVEPRERPVFSLGEVIEEGSNVLLNGTILGGLRVQSLKLTGGTPQTLSLIFKVLCGGGAGRSKLWCERVGRDAGGGGAVL